MTRYIYLDLPIKISQFMWVNMYIYIYINPLDCLGDMSFFGFGFGLGFTPWKINMDHNDGGLVQIIFLSKWVICRFQPLNLPGCRESNFGGAFASGNALHWQIGQEDGGFEGPKIPTFLLVSLRRGKS